MKYLIVAAAFAFAITGPIIPAIEAQEFESSSTQSYYLFMSGKVSAQVKRAVFPVERFDGKRLHLEGYAKALRPTRKLACSLNPLMVITPYFADIYDLEYSFDSNAEKYRTMMAINEMTAEQMRFEAANEFEKAIANPPGSQGPPITQQDRDNMELDELTKEQRDDELRLSGLNKRIDTIYVRCTIVPNRNLENVFAVAVISFENAGIQGASQGKRTSFARFASIGDLQAGIGEKVKFDSTFTELRASEANVDLFLFDGDGKHIATNLSRGLKELSPEELEEFRNLDKKAKTASSEKTE